MRIPVPEHLIDCHDRDPELRSWANSLGMGSVIESWQGHQHGTVLDSFHDHGTASWVMIIAHQDHDLGTELIDGTIEPCSRGQALIIPGTVKHRAQSGHTDQPRSNTVLLLL